MDLSVPAAFLRVEGVEGASAMGSRRIRLFGKCFRSGCRSTIPFAEPRLMPWVSKWLDIDSGEFLRGGALAPGAIIRLDGMDFSIALFEAGNHPD
jgi:hypothetical protein